VTNRIPVKPVADFEENSREIVHVDGSPVGVFKVDGEFYALENRCKHAGGPVCKGQVRNELVGEFVDPGEHVEESYTGSPTVACPWHGYTYRLDSGDHVGDESISLTTFDVDVEDGTVYLAIDR
jgi:nitrite reductase/ring-hydroxylating ferredoxin subunit